MNKHEVYALLKERDFWFEVTEREAVYDMDALTNIQMPYPDSQAKNLFIRDDKKRNFYLVSVQGDKRVDLKAFQEQHGTRRLSFASEKYLHNILNLTPGAVTPLGLLNDADCTVQFFLDEDLLAEPGVIGVHPNDNTATVWMKTADLIELIEDHGNAVTVFAA